MIRELFELLNAWLHHEAPLCDLLRCYLDGRPVDLPIPYTPAE